MKSFFHYPNELSEAEFDRIKREILSEFKVIEQDCDARFDCVDEGIKSAFDQVDENLKQAFDCLDREIDMRQLVGVVPLVALLLALPGGVGAAAVLLCVLLAGGYATAYRRSFLRRRRWSRW